MVVKIRSAVQDDMVDVLAMIQELADFEQMSNGPQLKVEDLIRDGGFTSDNGSRLFHCFVAELHDNNERRSQSIKIGYALGFYCYSTWEGKALFLEDLYVKPEFRTQGVGRMLFTHVTRFAKETGCSRVDFHVLSWNPAREFYNKIGAIDLTAAEDWHLYRMTSEAMDALCSQTHHE